MNQSPAQVWATLLDEGNVLCLIRTMYRILAENGRRPTPDATHPSFIAIR